MRTRRITLDGIQIDIDFDYEKPEPESGYPGGYEIYKVTPDKLPLRIITYQEVITALEEQRLKEVEDE